LEQQLAISIESRKDPGEYWTSVMKDQPMPEAIQGLVHRDSAPSQPTKNANCDHDHPSMGTRNKNQPFAEDFEPRPNVSAYNDDLLARKRRNLLRILMSQMMMMLVRKHRRNLLRILSRDPMSQLTMMMMLTRNLLRILNPDQMLLFIVSKEGGAI
jgi:hypothetical protein